MIHTAQLYKIAINLARDLEEYLEEYRQDSWNMGPDTFYRMALLIAQSDRHCRGQLAGYQALVPLVTKGQGYLKALDRSFVEKIFRSTRSDDQALLDALEDALESGDSSGAEDHLEAIDVRLLTAITLDLPEAANTFLHQCQVLIREQASLLEQDTVDWIRRLLETYSACTTHQSRELWNTIITSTRV